MHGRPYAPISTEDNCSVRMGSTKLGNKHGLYYPLWLCSRCLQYAFAYGVKRGLDVGRHDYGVHSPLLIFVSAYLQPSMANSTLEFDQLRNTPPFLH